MDGETIYAYSRANALEDGSLVDVTDKAKTAGFVYPVALSQALHADIADIPATRSYETYEGRLWDVLSMCRLAIRRRLSGTPSQDVLTFKTLLTLGDVPEDDDEFNPDNYIYWIKATVGPGDNAEPVLTLMKIGED